MELADSEESAGPLALLVSLLDGKELPLSDHAFVSLCDDGSFRELSREAASLAVRSLGKGIEKTRLFTLAAATALGRWQTSGRPPKPAVIEESLLSACFVASASSLRGPDERTKEAMEKLERDARKISSLLPPGAASATASERQSRLLQEISMLVIHTMGFRVVRPGHFSPARALALCELIAKRAAAAAEPISSSSSSSSSSSAAVASSDEQKTDEALVAATFLCDELLSSGGTDEDEGDEEEGEGDDEDDELRKQRRDLERYRTHPCFTRLASALSSSSTTQPMMGVGGVGDGKGQVGGGTASAFHVLGFLRRLLKENLTGCGLHSGSSSRNNHASGLALLRGALSALALAGLPASLPPFLPRHLLRAGSTAATMNLLQASLGAINRLPSREPLGEESEEAEADDEHDEDGGGREDVHSDDDDERQEILRKLASERNHFLFSCAESGACKSFFIPLIQQQQLATAKVALASSSSSASPASTETTVQTGAKSLLHPRTTASALLSLANPQQQSSSSSSSSSATASPLCSPKGLPSRSPSAGDLALFQALLVLSTHPTDYRSAEGDDDASRRRYFQLFRALLLSPPPASLPGPSSSVPLAAVVINDHPVYGSGSNSHRFKLLKALLLGDDGGDNINVLTSFTTASTSGPGSIITASLIDVLRGLVAEALATERQQARVKKDGSGDSARGASSLLYDKEAINLVNSLLEARMRVEKQRRRKMLVVPGSLPLSGSSGSAAAIVAENLKAMVARLFPTSATPIGLGPHSQQQQNDDGDEGEEAGSSSGTTLSSSVLSRSFAVDIDLSLLSLMRLLVMTAKGMAATSAPLTPLLAEYCATSAATAAPSSSSSLRLLRDYVSSLAGDVERLQGAYRQAMGAAAFDSHADPMDEKGEEKKRQNTEASEAERSSIAAAGGAGVASSSATASLLGLSGGLEVEPLSEGLALLDSAVAPLKELLLLLA
jgi:hypothetical protein